MLKIILHITVLVVITAVIYYLSDLAQTKIPASKRLKCKIGFKLEALFVLILGPFIVHDMCPSLSSLIIGWGAYTGFVIIFIFILTTEIKIGDNSFLYKTLTGTKTIDYDSITKIKRSDIQCEYIILYNHSQKIKIPFFIIGCHEFIKFIRTKKNAFARTEENVIFPLPDVKT